MTRLWEKLKTFGLLTVYDSAQHLLLSCSEEMHWVKYELTSFDDELTSRSSAMCFSPSIVSRRIASPPLMKSRLSALACVRKTGVPAPGPRKYSVPSSSVTFTPTLRGSSQKNSPVPDERENTRATGFCETEHPEALCTTNQRVFIYKNT